MNCNWLPEWLRVSNRWKHLVGIFIVSLFGTILMGIGCAGGMEFKDVHYHNGDHVPMRYWDWSAWDWLDIATGMIGGLLAVAVHVAIYLIVR